jgi:hypothetical protein
MASSQSSESKDVLSPSTSAAATAADSIGDLLIALKLTKATSAAEAMADEKLAQQLYMVTCQTTTIELYNSDTGSGEGMPPIRSMEATTKVLTCADGAKGTFGIKLDAAEEIILEHGAELLDDVMEQTVDGKSLSDFWRSYFDIKSSRGVETRLDIKASDFCDQRERGGGTGDEVSTIELNPTVRTKYDMSDVPKAGEQVYGITSVSLISFAIVRT